MNELVMPGLLISCVQTRAKNMSCGWFFFFPQESIIYIHHTSAGFQAALQTLSALIQMRLDVGAKQSSGHYCGAWTGWSFTAGEASRGDGCPWLTEIAVMDRWLRLSISSRSCAAWLVNDECKRVSLTAVYCWGAIDNCKLKLKDGRGFSAALIKSLRWEVWVRGGVRRSPGQERPVTRRSIQVWRDRLLTEKWSLGFSLRHWIYPLPDKENSR